MIDTSRLEQAIAAAKPGQDSFIALFRDFKAQLAAELANDPATQQIVNDAADKVLANSQALADAMAQG